jgi:TonB family protein
MFLMIAAAAAAPASLPVFSSGLRPASPPLTWIMSDDYPGSAQVQQEQGVVDVRLEIAPEGTPTGCDIIESSGFKDLDAAACLALLKRARFYPIKAPDGQPVAGVFRRSVTWVNSNPKRLRFPAHSDLDLNLRSLPPGVKSPAIINAEIVVDATGKIESCVPDSGDALDTLGPVACQQVAALLRPQPARDASGSPTRTMLIETVQFAAEDATDSSLDAKKATSRPAR